MHAATRIVLTLGSFTVLVATVAMWREAARERAAWASEAAFGRGPSGEIEGRAVRGDELSALALDVAGLPPLVARVRLGFGVVEAEVEESGRFIVPGIPPGTWDVELALGDEPLAEISGVTVRGGVDPEGTNSATDPRLAQVELAGPVSAIELTLVAADGRAPEDGWLAWRPVGAEAYTRAAPVRDGRAVLATLADAVDVRPLVPGYAADEHLCLFGGERLHLTTAPAILAEAPEDTQGLVLRLEVVQAEALPGLAGHAALRASEVRGGWCEDGRGATLWVVGSGALSVVWGAYARGVDGRLVRARGARSSPRAVGPARDGVRRVLVPLVQDGVQSR